LIVMAGFWRPLGRWVTGRRTTPVTESTAVAPSRSTGR
jgi:hypothetical protein